MKTYDLRINNKIYTLDDAYALYEDVLNIDCFCDIECKSLNNIKDLDKLNRNDRARMSYYLDIKLERVVDKILFELDIKKEKLKITAKKETRRKPSAMAKISLLAPIRDRI